MLIDESEEAKTTDEGNRIYHTWDKWECYKARFYEDNPPDNMSRDEAVSKYRQLLTNTKLFSDVLNKIIHEWKYSCEHYLTNERMNRIAWLGQAALAYQYNIPAIFRIGYHQLTEDQKKEADKTALKYLNIWLSKRDGNTLTMQEAQSKTEPNLY